MIEAGRLHEEHGHICDSGSWPNCGYNPCIAHQEVPEDPQVGRWLLVLVLLIAIVAALGGDNTELARTSPDPLVPCQEDEPCWDCKTMGNRICGDPEPTISATVIYPEDS